MSLAPGITELLARARTDLRLGLPVVLCDETTCMLAMAAETASPERLADMRALGQPHVALTRHRAQTLKARVYDDDIARIALPDTAGIGWIRALANPADDLRQPMKGPLTALRSGNAQLSRDAVSLTKTAHLLPAALLVPLDGSPPPEGLTRLDLSRIGPALRSPGTLVSVASARVPLEVSKAGRVHVFRTTDGGDEHYAVEIGRPARNRPVLARLHSACFTGDLLHSLKCDCGPQLRGALARMGEEGAGILLYLNQEGRGIGLANKMRAYDLQDQGFDTVEANHRLGFEDDERDFRIGAMMLKALGFSSVRLLTNNPRKVKMMQQQGIDVQKRVALVAGRNPHNAAYLETKARKSGHIL